MSVSSRTKQAGEVHARWSWVEPAVWTERMLTTLEKGVKGGPWFSLIDKVYSKRALRSAFAKVKANKGAPGIDHVTIKKFEMDLDKNLERLHIDLKDGTYRPQVIRRKYTPKPGKRCEKRPLGIPTVRDRVVQTALRSVLEPIFEREFAITSFGFRPQKGCKDALRQVQYLLREGYSFVVDADLQNFFDTISHKRLMVEIRQRIADNRVLKLIELFLKQEVMCGVERWTPETGSPQGAVISPLLSHIYLNEQDHLMGAHGFEMVRNADDLVILCKTADEANRAYGLLCRWVNSAALVLHPTKTRIGDISKGGFNFLGYHFLYHFRIVCDKSIKSLKEKLRKKTRRSRGDSIDTIIKDVNRTLKGWFEYFKHSRPSSFYPIDGWLRVRLRSILRKQNKLPSGGWGGNNNIRWPNSFFAEHGLFFLADARAAASQPAQR